MTHSQNSPPPMYSPAAYARVPAPLPLPVPPSTAADHGGLDLGTAPLPLPLTPYTPHTYSHDASPIAMPEPQRPPPAGLFSPPLAPLPPPPLPQRTHASVLSPPLTATTQLLMPSPPLQHNAAGSRLFAEPVPSAPGSSSFLVERIPVDDLGRPLVTASPPHSSGSMSATTRAAVSVPVTPSAPPPASLSRQPGAPANASSSSLSRPTLPDWAKDPDDDRPPVRGPVYLTLPFLLKLLLVLTLLAGIVTIRVVLPAYLGGASGHDDDDDNDDAPPATTFLLAYQWLLVIALAYALAYLVPFSSCLYNRYARKVSVSPQRQAWKLRVRQWFLLPAELAMALTWIVMSLVMGLVQSDWALYAPVCATTPAVATTAAPAAPRVSCTQATTLLVVAAILAAGWGVSALQVLWAIWKNAKKVAEFSSLNGDDPQQGPPAA